jgi:RNA polymerase II subunit A small phosphatase-like protein
MNKTSKDLDLSSIITQVSKDDEVNRTIPLTNTIITSGTSPTTKTRSNRKRRFMSILLCCLTVSNRNRPKSSIYSPKADTPASELIALNSELNVHLESNEKFLLPTLRLNERVKICLVIDLDETLVHSSFKPVPNADFIVPVEIDGQVHQVYVTKRPHVDEFLRRVGELYECVLFTASLAKYADPVADLLDPNQIFHSRLFRESCTYYNGNYIKDLNRLGRDIRKVIIIDNSPVSYIFHQDNAIPVTSWFDDMHDTELLTLIPIFECLTSVDDVIPAIQDIHRRRAIV